MNTVTVRLDDEAKALIDEEATKREVTSDEYVQAEVDARVEMSLNKKRDHWFTHLSSTDKKRIYDAENL